MLCYIRRRTGSVRTGIALHGAQNVVATPIHRRRLVRRPAAALLVASLYVTRVGAGDGLSLAARRAFDGVTAAARRSIAALVALPLPAAGVGDLRAALAIGVSLVSVHAAFDLGGSGWETAGRAVTALIAIPLLAWLLATAPRTWGAPATTCALGPGCALVVVFRVLQFGFDRTALVTLVVLGYSLVKVGLAGLAATTIAVPLRVSAGAAAVCLVFTVTPVPFITTSRGALLDRSLVAIAAVAIALAAVGLTIADHDHEA